MDNIFHRKHLITTIAKEQSFSKAAQKLFIAQPSLSLMVKALESELGTPLFDRSSKPIRLTEAGQEYVRAAGQIQEIEHAYMDYIVSLNNLDTGSLRIGSNQLLSSLVLPRYVAGFMQKYPKIQISITDANSTTLENEISNGALDIVIDNSVLPDELFERHYLTSEHLLLAVPKHFPENSACMLDRLTYEDILNGRHINGADPVSLEHFTETPFILMNRNNDTRKQTNTIFQEVGFTPKVLFEMDRLSTLYSYVEQGLAASLVSDTLVKNIRGISQRNIHFYVLPTRYNHRNIYVYYKKNKFCTQAMTTFMEGLSKITW